MTNNTKRGHDAAPTASAPSGEAEHYATKMAQQDLQGAVDIMSSRATPPAAPIAQPVGQVRNDLDRVNVVWFGPLPAHGTNLYAAPIAPAIGQQADSGAERATDYIMAAVECYANNRDPRDLARIRHMVAEGQSAIAAHLSATNSGTAPTGQAATTASASGDDCEHCNGVGYFLDEEGELIANCRECEYRAPAPSREAQAAHAGAEEAGLVNAVRKLVKAKGRFHTEQNYKALIDALDKYDAAPATEKGKP
jgi:hypothetical protein